MTVAMRELLSSTAVAVLSLCSLQAVSAPDTNAKPSVDVLRNLESKVPMPAGAEALVNYVRFYYAKAESPGWIYGMYVAKRSIEPEDLPSEEIVVVEESGDVPAPFDAGCDVVFVSYDVRNDKLGAAYCAAELSL